MMNRHSVLALSSLLGASLLGGFGQYEPIMPAVVSRPGEAPRRSYQRGSNWYQPNGKREVARRLRQIQNGQLKVSA